MESISTNKTCKRVYSIVLHSVYVMIVMTFVLGIIYPVVITYISQVIFPYQANGSIIEQNGKAIGSDLIGQNFDKIPYFKSRPSATDYDAADSSGTNYGVINEKLTAQINKRAAFWKDATKSDVKIPADLLTASSSGIDPHISHAAAMYQVNMVAKNTGISKDKLVALIDENTTKNMFGGDGIVNVLHLNMAVDKLAKAK